jgi:tRNA dimethylallyltransferase
MRGVRHHLLDVADPKKRFHAEKYRILAHAAIDDIVSRGKLPIICGGTGFYIDAVLSDNPFPNVPPDLKLRKRLSTKSPADLLLILKKLDPKRARVISKSNSEKKNARRIIRAIEVAYKERPCTNQAIQGETLYKPRVALVQTKANQQMIQQMIQQTIEHNRHGAHARARAWLSPCTKYGTIFIGIKPDPAELKKRILNRLDKRLKHGMIAEAKHLHRQGLSWRRMDELGLEYRYLAKYLQGKISKEEMVERLNTEIWHYAKRQMTWWKRNEKIKWFEPQETEKINGAVGTFLGFFIPASE